MCPSAWPPTAPCPLYPRIRPPAPAGSRSTQALHQARSKVYCSAQKNGVPYRDPLGSGRRGGGRGVTARAPSGSGGRRGAAAFVRRPLPAPAAGGRPPARRPPTIVRRVGSRAVPETFPPRRRRRQRPSPGRRGALSRGRRRLKGHQPEEGGAGRPCGRPGPGPGGAGEPWGRRPAPRPRPRSGTGTTWTAASPATASASPSACGSAPPPAGSPPTRCNRDRTGRRGGGGRVGRGGRGALTSPSPTSSLLETWREGDREGGDRRQRSSAIERSFRGRTGVGQDFFPDSAHGEAGARPAGGGWVVQCMGSGAAAESPGFYCQRLLADWRCELGKLSEPRFPHVDGVDNSWVGWQD